MFRLALRTLRFRTGGFIATFIAMFFGTAIVMACGGLMESGIRTDVTPQRLAGAAVVVTGETTWALPKQNPADEEEDSESATLSERVALDDELVAKVGAVPGVATAIGDVSFPVSVLGERGPVGDGALGHGWDSAELMPYRVSDGGEPGRGEVVLEAAMAREAGASVGDEITVAAHGVAESYRVAGIATSTVNTTRHGMFFSAEDLPSLVAHPGTVDSIGVLAEPGTDLGALRQRIADALPGEPVVTLVGGDRGMAEFPEAQRSQENVIVIAAVFGGLAIMVAMFVVASTLGLTVQHREREMALMRAIGTTPGQLRRMVLGEAMMVSVLATALAMLPGSLLGQWLFEQLAEGGVVPSVVRFHQGWVPVVVAAGAALLTAFGAALVAARRAASARPTEALVEASVQRRWLTPFRFIGALLCFGGGIALAIVTMTVMTGPIAASTAGPSVMLWAIGLAFIAPGITKLVTTVVAGPIRALSGLAGWLATLNAKARAVRMAAAVTPIMLATGIATANIYLQTTQADAAEKAFTENLRADVVLSSSTGGLAPEVLGAVRSVPGVAGASEFATSTGFVERPYDNGQAEEGSPVQGVTADSVAATTAVSLTAGRLEDLTGDTVALPDEQARRIGREVGDTITMRMGDRSQVDVRVVALFTARPGFELVLMPASLVTAHTTSGLPAQILVRAAPGVDLGQLTSALAERTREWPGVGVADRGVLTANFAQDQKTGAWVNYLMVGMIITYTAISVVNTLVMATARRRREFGLQRLTGATRGQVMRMMTVEAALVAGVGVLLGSIVSLTTLVPFSIVVSDTPVPSGPLWIYLAIVGTVGVLTLVSTLLPARAAMRARPAEAATNPE